MTTIGSLVVNVKANINDLRSGLSKGTGLVNAASQKFSGLGTVLKASLAAGVMAAVAAFAILVTAIIGVGGAVANLGNELDGSMRLLQARTGAATEEMAAFRDITLDLYTSGVGDNISQIADALGAVKQITGETGAELQALTQHALIMSAVFDVDVTESIRAVDAATESFGINGTRVFDLFTTTIQRVGDPMGDLFDTVNEYSTVFAQAGFSAEQMFGILQAGIEAGAPNFDFLADVVKEFGIKMVDGSATTEDALNTLFIAVGEGNQELAGLQTELDLATVALAENEAALTEAKGAYAASKTIVDNLQRSLDEARRALNDLSHPNLAGMTEFDDTLFGLEQQSKSVKLAMLDMTPDTDAYAAAQAQLDSLNNEMDRVSLQRDLTFDSQLRDIEKAATAGLEPVTTYDEVMGQIASRQSEIAGLEQSFASANAEMMQNAETVETLETLQSGLTARIAELQSGIELADNPAREFLAGFEDGSLTGADAMSHVIERLKAIDNEVSRNQIGVDLFGTKWEDLGANVVLAMDPALTAIGDVQGATLAAGETVQQGFGALWERTKRKTLTALLPIRDKILDLANRAMPVVEDSFAWFEVQLPLIIALAGGWFDWLVGQIETSVIPFVTGTLIPTFKRVGDWLINEGWPAFQAFMTPIINQVVPGLMLLGNIIVNLATAAMPYISQAFSFFTNNLNIFLPIIGVVIAVVASLSSPVLFVAGLVVLLATAWANNWGGIQQKTQAVIDFVWPYIVLAMNTISQTVSSVLGYMSAWWTAHGDSVMTLVSFAWEFITGYIQFKLAVIWAIIQIVLTNIQSFWDTWGGTIMTIVSMAWENIKAIIQGAMDIVGFIIDAAAALIEGDWDAFWVAIEGIVNTAWSTMQTMIQNAGVVIQSIILTAWGLIRDTIQTKIDGIKSSVEGMKSSVTTTWTSFSDGISNKWNDIWNGIKTKVDEVISHIQSAFDSLPDISSIGAGLGDNIPAWLIPHSPTPFEIGIKGINQAISQMPVFPNLGENVSLPPLATVQVSGGKQAGGDNGHSSSSQPPSEPKERVPLIGQLIIYANDEAGGQRAANKAMSTLRSRGLL